MAVETVLWPTIPLVENMDYSLEKFSCLELENVNPVVQNLSKSKKKRGQQNAKELCRMTPDRDVLSENINISHTFCSCDPFVGIQEGRSPELWVGSVQ